MSTIQEKNTGKGGCGRKRQGGGKKRMRNMTEDLICSSGTGVKIGVTGCGIYLAPGEFGRAEWKA